MKALRRITSKLAKLLLVALFLALAPLALASNTWYVDGVNGNDNNDCKSPQTACKTIGHAISLASSGDSVMVAPATYTENLTINISLKIIGAAPKTTIVDGGGNGTVFTISGGYVTLSKLTIRNGNAQEWGGGIFNGSALTLNRSIVTANSALNAGGGIACSDWGTLTVNHSTITANSTANGSDGGGGVAIFQCTATINNSTISGNSAPAGSGGGIFQNGTWHTSTTLQNTIVAKNSDRNCGWGSTITSNGYNLSSDFTCKFNGPGDMNSTSPKLGTLGYHGGPTQTIPLREGIPAIDAGNPNGCTDGKGNLLKTDQRGYPRPDKEDVGGCDIGAYEKQSD
jgi:hypothetical protein